jgi:hypothetical protein
MASADPALTGEDTGSAARTRGYIGLGVAGVAALTGTVTGILAISKKPDCPNDTCDISLKDDADASTTYGTVATVAFGVAGLATAYALWELLANAPSEPAAASVRLPTVIATGSGARIELSGTF